MFGNQQVQEEMVTVPVSSLPPEYVRTHLRKENDQPIPGDHIPKRHAAIEVVKVMGKLKLVSIVAIVALLICVLGSFISFYVSTIALIAGLGFIGFFFAKNENEMKMLQFKYRI